MKRFYFGAAAALMLSAPVVHAADYEIDIVGLAQEEFKLLSEDLTAALSYKAIAPAEPLGLIGFDVGVEASVTSMSNSDQWVAAVSGGEELDSLPVPKLHAHLGLPFNIDVGLMYTSIPTTNITLIGGELRYSFVSGNVAIPAIAVRGTMTKASGVDDLDFSTTGLEATISKGFVMFTPYAGLGSIWSTSEPSASTGLEKEEFQQTKTYVGVNINLGLINFALEGDKTGDNTTYSGKVGFRF